VVEPRVIGRYALHDEIASGGMATVHLGRLIGSVGFARTVAIKRLHAHCAKEPDFVSMFVDEARLVARIRHPNVVPTLDVVSEGEELFLVMEYVHGASLAKLASGFEGERMPLRVAAAVTSQLLQGLHAAHEAKNERGEPLGIVHRDVSPQNVLVGVDGVTRVLDFGVAKAAGRLHTTKDGQLKGKLAYMAHEQLKNGEITRRTDIYAASIVLWELLTGRRLFKGDSEAVTVERVLFAKIDPPSTHNPEVSPALDALTMKGLSREAEDRFPTAQEMAEQIEKLVAPATTFEIGRAVESAAKELLGRRAALIAAIENAGSAPAAAPASGKSVDSKSFPFPLADSPPPSIPISSQPLVDVAPPWDVQTRTTGGVTTQPAPGPSTPPPPKKRTPLALVAIGGAIVVAGVVVGVALRREPHPESSRSAPSLESPGAAPPPPSATPTAPPAITTATTTTTSEPPVASSVPPVPSARPIAITPPRKSAQPRPAPSAGSSAPQDCNPPFVLDNLGRKIWKRGCI
jgi:serine/threonine-protein kinase